MQVGRSEDLRLIVLVSRRVWSLAQMERRRASAQRCRRMSRRERLQFRRYLLEERTLTFEGRKLTDEKQREREEMVEKDPVTERGASANGYWGGGQIENALWSKITEKQIGGVSDEEELDRRGDELEVKHAERLIALTLVSSRRRCATFRRLTMDGRTKRRHAMSCRTMQMLFDAACEHEDGTARTSIIRTHVETTKFSA